jgi:alpha-galactosidase
MNQEAMERYKLVRTSIDTRKQYTHDAEVQLDAYLAGDETLPNERSRETAADIISAQVEGREFIDVMNVPNRGQITSLPEGAVVETLGVVNRAGFTPLSVGELPREVNDLVRRHCENQDMIVEAGLRGDRELALHALYNDPLCSHLSYPKIRQMGEKLLASQGEINPVLDEL